MIAACTSVNVVSEVGHFAHACENDLVCWTTCGKIPFFNAPIYFENKQQIGKIDEIFGNPKENVRLQSCMNIR